MPEVTEVPDTGGSKRGVHMDSGRGPEAYGQLTCGQQGGWRRADVKLTGSHTDPTTPNMWAGDTQALLFAVGSLAHLPCALERWPQGCVTQGDEGSGGQGFLSSCLSITPGGSAPAPSWGAAPVSGCRPSPQEHVPFGAASVQLCRDHGFPLFLDPDCPQPCRPLSLPQVANPCATRPPLGVGEDRPRDTRQCPAGKRKAGPCVLHRRHHRHRWLVP